MARLKIGSGIQFEAQLPKLEQSAPEVEQLSEADIRAMVQKAVDSLPKPEAQVKYDVIKELVIQEKEADLGPIYKEIEKLKTELFLKIDDQKAIIPEVKMVIPAKDNTADIINYCKDMVGHAEISMMMKVNGLHNQNKRQKTINLGLCIALILTIFLHLL